MELSFLQQQNLIIIPFILQPPPYSQGAQEVFQELPHEYIEPEHLPKVATQGCE